VGAGTAWGHVLRVFWGFGGGAPSGDDGPGNGNPHARRDPQHRKPFAPRIFESQSGIGAEQGARRRSYAQVGMEGDPTWM